MAGEPVNDETGHDAPALLRRLGLAGAPADDRFNQRLILALLLIYAALFVAFYPRIPTNHDEANYIRQTLMVLEGHSTIVQIDAFSGEEIEVRPSTYPLGTSFLAAPFVALAGSRGAFVVPCLGLLAMVLLTARWIREEKHPAAFALLLLGFPPVLVMGRVVMSDVPSAAWVALGLLLFWRGLDRGAGWWLGAGFVAGSSMILRASNPLVFAPLFVGTVLRRERSAAALVVGGLAGLALRFATMSWYFGDAFFERDAYRFSPETISERLPLYLVGLLILVPGGLLLSLLYRGRRRPEVVTSIVIFFLFYLFQSYSTIWTGLSKRVVLALRYFIPILPLMVFAMAESVPRLWSGLLAARDAPSRRLLARLANVAVAAWLAAVLVGSLVVHPAFSRWSTTQAEIREEVDRVVPDEAVLVTNWRGTKKFIRQLDRRFLPIDTGVASPEQVTGLLDRHPDLYIVVLDRSDSDYWRGQIEVHAAYVAALGEGLELLADRRVTATDHLRIWRMRPAGSPG